MVWFRRRRKALDDDGAALIVTGGDRITLKDAQGGAVIFGETGAGKTSGPGACLQSALLRAGVGMLVLPAKVTDHGKLLRLCERIDRKPPIVFGRGQPYRFDFVKYELDQGATTESVAQFLGELVRLSSNSQAGGAGDNAYWYQTTDRALFFILLTVRLAKGTASVLDLYKIATSLPDKPGLLQDASWLHASNLGRFLLAATTRCRSQSEQGALDLCLDFWKEFAGLSDKPKSIVQSMLQNVFGRFVSPDLGDLFCAGDSNLTPDDVLSGELIYIDAPVLRDRETGQLVLAVWKLCTQRAALRRVVMPDTPQAVIWADEFQYVLTESDVLTATVSRESLLTTVALTQNIPALVSVLGGGDKAMKLVDAWLGNNVLKFFCCNSDKMTNTYASELCGSHWRTMLSGSAKPEAFDPVSEMMGLPTQHGFHMSQQWFPEVPVETFARLKKGGKINNCVVECIIYMGGRKWSNGHWHTRASFDQQ